MNTKQRKASPSAHEEAIRERKGNEANDTTSIPASIIRQQSANGTRAEPSLPRFLEAFRDEKQWVVMHVWKEHADDAKYKKRPINPTTGKAINHTDDANRLTWDEAHAALGPNRVIAFYLDENTNITVVDLDECFDGQALTPTASSLIRDLNSPVERSFSGNGIHCFIKADLPKGFSSKPPVEVYQTKRLMIVTGDFLPGHGDRKELPDRTEVIRRYITEHPETPDDLLVRYPESHSDDQLMELVRNSPADYKRFREIVEGDWHDRSQGVWHLLTFFSDFSISVDQCARLTDAAPVVDLGKWATSAHNRETTTRKLMQHKAHDWALVHAQRVQKSKGGTAFRYLTLAEAISVPPGEYLITDYIPQGALGVLYGESQVGKSFLALDMAFHIALGRDWCGYPVRQGPVVYLAAEGGGGFAKRLHAWCIHNNLDGEELETIQMRMLYQTMNLANPADAAAFIDSLDTLPKVPAVVFIDTLSWVMVGEDENSAMGVGPVFDAARRARERYGVSFVFIHHTGHNGEGPRGSYVIKANLDFRMKVQSMRSKADGGYPNRLKLIVEKMKDDREELPLAFERKVINLPVPEKLGRYGKYKPVTSCVVEEVEIAQSTYEDSSIQNTELEQKILDALLQAEGQGYTDSELKTAMGFVDEHGKVQKVGPSVANARNTLFIAGQIAMQAWPEGKRSRGRRYYHIDYAPKDAVFHSGGDVVGSVS